MATTLDWVKSLRADIRGDCGKGWNLRGREVGGKMVMQIDRNDENGRSTLLTNIGWRKDNKRNILNAIVEIKDYMYHNGDSLKEAYKKFSNQSEYAPVIKGQLKGWAANKKAFLDSRSNRRSTTLYDLTKRVELACRFLEKSPKPQNAKDLFLRIKKEYFDVAPPHKGSKKKLKNPEGGDGRKRNCGDIKSFLNYCVEKKLVNANLWTAPSSDWLQEEIIKTKDSEEYQSKVPIKSNELVQLLEEIENKGNLNLWLAVGLVGCFGLRPAELGALSVENGRLFVGTTVKRNKHKLKKNDKPKAPEMVVSVDPIGLEGLGDRLVQLYAKGTIKLPLGVIRAIEKRGDNETYKPIGRAFGQLLKRQKSWKKLNLNRSENEQLDPYSLRHGFAYRCHVEMENPISATEVAGFMRHDTNTHNDVYANYIDNDQKERSRDRLVGKLS